jgi:hypothetical protein
VAVLASAWPGPAGAADEPPCACCEQCADGQCAERNGRGSVCVEGACAPYLALPAIGWDAANRDVGVGERSFGAWLNVGEYS